MATIESTIKLIKECNIELEYCNLPDNIYGIFHREDNYDLIIINSSIVNNDVLHLEILSEEFGHYFTNIGDNTPRKNFTYNERLTIDIYEEKALRWACNYLIPTVDLLDLLNEKSNRNPNYICEHYNISINMLHHKYRFMALKKPYWQINSSEHLVLTGHPSVYIASLHD